LKKRQDGSKDDEPHFHEVGNETVVRDVAECLVEGAEARMQELVEIFDEDYGGALVDAAFDVDGD
jgi:hypothetical protein